MKSGNLNLLEPLGPVQACTGVAYLYVSPFQASSEDLMLLIRPTNAVRTQNCWVQNK